MTEFPMPPLEVESTTKIAEIPPIQQTASVFVREREDLRDIVESPLLPACFELYDKNIRTWTSSANAENLQFPEHAGIGIHYESLSERNKQVAAELGAVILDEQGKRSAFLHIPIDARSTVASVRQDAGELVDKFHKQKMRWATTYSLEQVKEWSGHASDDSVSPKQLADETGLYFDTDTNTYYLSEEQYNKATEDVEE